MKQFAIKIFISRVGLIAVMLSYPFTLAHPHHGTKWYFSSSSLKTNKRFVMWQGDCVEWSWKLEGIRAVYSQ
jgi:hypothetical protein